VNLWLTSEPEYYDVVSYIIESYGVEERAAELEVWVREEFDRLGMLASLWSDLLSASLDRVNWREIIESNQ